MKVLKIRHLYTDVFFALDKAKILRYTKKS